MAEGEKEGGGGEMGDESVKLFVGQVPKHMKEEELLDLFKEVALVDEVSIIKDKVTKASRGCCFLICPSRQDADKAVTACHNKRTLHGASSPMQVKYADGEIERLEHKLFVGMLPKSISDTEVAALFSKYGTIRDLQILRGFQQTSKCCAFLKYETKVQALAALEALNGKHRMEGSNVPLVVKWADTEKERQARRTQKAQSQATNIPNANSMQQPSIFGALPMGYMPSYNGYGYQPPGTYGVMQSPLAPMQNQATFHSMVPSVNQGNSLQGVSPDISPGIAPKSFNTTQSAGFMGSPFPALPGLQYPLSYPMNSRQLGNSHGSGQQPVNIKIYPSTSSSHSTTSGGQIEVGLGPPGANLFIFHIPQDYGDQELSNAFQGFGRVLSAKVFVEKATGVSKCFGFVSYDSPADAQAAIEVMNGFQLGDPTVQVHHKQSGGFRGKSFFEGWVEFTMKSVAKNVTRMLNGEQTGGKKRLAFYYDIWNIKYLSKFKWDDLIGELATKKREREEKMKLEISAAKRERDFYMSKVEQSRALKFMRERKEKKQKVEGEESNSAPLEAKVIRQFPQNQPVQDGGQNKPRLSKDLLAGVFGQSFT